VASQKSSKESKVKLQHGNVVMQDGYLYYLYARYYISSYSVTNKPLRLIFCPTTTVHIRFFFIWASNNSSSMDVASVPIYCIYPVFIRFIACRLALLMPARQILYAAKVGLGNAVMQELGLKTPQPKMTG
jgi:hypothetical protein